MLSPISFPAFRCAEEEIGGPAVCIRSSFVGEVFKQRRKASLQSCQIDWRGYKVIPGETPLAIFVHVCSTKIPYKTVGKEFIADRPEVEHEILNAIREASRNLRIYLSRREHLAQEKKRVDVFEKYLPKVAQFSTKLSGSKKEPDIQPLLKSLVKYGIDEGKEKQE